MRRVQTRALPSVPITAGFNPGARLLPKHQVEPRPRAGGTFLSGEKHGEDRKNSRPEKGHGYQQIYRLSQVWQGYAHREADQGPRARRSGRDLYFLLGLRILRKTLDWLLAIG